MSLSPEVLERLAAMGMELHHLSSDEYDVVVKRPDRPSYKRFKSMMSDPQKRVDALEQLMRDCLVHPTRQEFDAMLDKRPALGDLFGARVLELAGLTAEAEAKKL